MLRSTVGCSVVLVSCGFFPLWVGWGLSHSANAAAPAALAPTPVMQASGASQARSGRPPLPCTVHVSERTTGAGQCPGGQGSACETQTYTKITWCAGTCPEDKPNCVYFERVWDVIYRQTVYEGDCDPPTD
jgi:hypothetical protein